MRLRRLDNTERLISLLLLLGATACATWPRGLRTYGWPQGGVSCLSPMVFAERGSPLTTAGLERLESAFPGPVGVIGLNSLYVHPVRGAWFLVDPAATAVNCLVGAALTLLLALLVPESRAALRRSLGDGSARQRPARPGQP